jgi:SAM-dependent methyltransferase
MGYKGRPGASPVVAGLFAAGVIRKDDRVLDIGCHTGTDCLALLSWGIEETYGLDDDAESIKRAQRRAKRYRVTRDPESMFHQGSVTRIHDCFEDSSFTVIIDSLCWNNIRSAAIPGYARQVYRLLSPGGLLIIQARESASPFDRASASRYFPPSLRRYFVMSPIVVSHLAERPQSPKDPPYATVAISIGRRRTMPQR